MKTINKVILIAIFGLTLLVSCSENKGLNDSTELLSETNLKTVARADSKIKASVLPKVVLDYIVANYPNVTVVSSEIENNGNYEVKLSNNVELIFSATGTFIGIDNDSNGNDYDDTDILPANLPQVILDYITTNYSSNTITEAELENNGNYEVELNDGVVLIFDANGTFLGTGVDGDNDENIDPAALPQVILTYITTNYPAQTIIEAEVEDSGHYEVTLSNGVELYFDANGVFLKADTDNDNSGNINPADLPQVIRTYITTNYPALTITKAEIEDNGQYEVTLSNGVELYFDANGVFLRTDNIDPATLPQVIITYVTTNYPAQTITKAEIEDNGHYDVKLSNGIELIFDANGVFLRIED